MSNEIRNKLDKAKDEVEELQEAYTDIRSSFRQDQSFMDLMSTIGAFLANEVNEVRNAMRDAVGEIERLDDENYDLKSEIDKLNERIGEMESEENND